MWKYKEIGFCISIALCQMAMIKGTADFIAKANPGFLTIEGKNAKIDASGAKVDEKNMIGGTFVVSVKEFSTGIDQRDEHMRGYLDAEKYPTATLKLNPVSMAGGTKKAFTGDLTLHGVTKPVSGIVEFSPTTATASFTIDVTQFGIKVPTYKLLTVGKSVDVTAKLDLQ